MDPDNEISMIYQTGIVIIESYLLYGLHDCCQTPGLRRKDKAGF
jgi:hypothetical protein